MYYNKSCITRVRHKLGKKTCNLIGILVIAVIVFCIVQYYKTHTRNESAMENATLINRYAKLIKEHLTSTYASSSYSDERSKLFLRSWSDEKDELFTAYKWLDSSEMFGSMLTNMKHLLNTVMKSSDSQLIADIWKKLEICVQTICAKIILPLNQRVPWGKNWYQFSIQLTQFLVFGAYLYRDLYQRTNRTFESWATTLVPEILLSPKSSLGWTREGPNAIMMAVAYLGAHILRNNYKKAIRHPDFSDYVMSYIKTSYVKSGEGFRCDGGFVFHGDVPAYGYIYESVEDFKLLTTLFQVPRTMDVLTNIRRLLDNPSPRIKTKFAPLYTRTNDKSNYSHVYGVYGFDVIPSVAVISVKQPEYTLQFRLQRPELAFYEADQTSDNLFQYAVMARQYYYADTDVMIRDELMTYYPGVISVGHRNLRKPTETATTTSFRPNRAESIICKLDDHTIGFYNEYLIVDLNFTVFEIMLITEHGYTVLYRVEGDQEQYFGDGAGESTDHTIYVSANLGTLSNSTDPLMNTSTAIHHFKNDSTIVHAGKPALGQLEVDEDRTKLDYLALRLNKDNMACFSTYHDKTGPAPTVTIGHNGIFDRRYKLYYHVNRDAKQNDAKVIDKYLYLIDTVDETACVGQWTPGPTSILKFTSKSIKRQLGAACTIGSTGSYNVASGVFTDMTYDLRAYSLFNSVIPRKDEEIVAMLTAANHDQ